MPRRTFKIAFICFTLFLPILLLAQNEVSFEGFTAPKKVYANSTFQVSFVLYNALGKNFRPPDLQPFKIVGGPYNSSQRSIVNGRASSKLSITYDLLAPASGKYTIGSASITVDNKTLTSDPFTVNVVEDDRDIDSKGEELFVRAEPDYTEAVIGQQIIVRYKIYTRYDVRRPDRTEEDNYPGFYAQPIRSVNNRTAVEEIDGKKYTTNVFYVVALFPQQTGTLTIPSTTIQVGVEMEDNDNNNFFFRPLKRVVLETEPVDIQVNNLPQDTTGTFTGAVGSYKIASQIQNSQITTDDAVSIKVSFVGDGDIKRIATPPLNFPENFEVYDPRIIAENTIERNGRLIGRKEIEYLAVPKSPGNYTINPKFSYFDPELGSYVLVEDETFFVDVTQGSNLGRVQIPQVPEAEESVEDIRYIKLSTEVHPQNQSFLNNPLFWIAFFIPFLSFLGLLVYRKMARSGPDQEELKIKKAKKVALKRLKTAEQLKEAGNSRAFYNEVSKAMLGYVSDKLKIPGSELTKENVNNKLQSLNLDSKHVDEFMSVLQTTEMALFAGKDNSKDMNETYQKAIHILATIEQKTRS